MAGNRPGGDRSIARCTRTHATLCAPLIAHANPTMPRASSPLELTYESFEQFWKALVSKRKARKLDVDVASAWRQLSDAGGGAAFLRLHAESKAVKEKRKSPVQAAKPAESARENAKIAKPAADTTGNEPATGTPPRASTKIATRTRRGADKKAAAVTRRGADKKAAAGTRRGARKKATGR